MTRVQTSNGKEFSELMSWYSDNTNCARPWCIPLCCNFYFSPHTCLQRLYFAILNCEFIQPELIQGQFFQVYTLQNRSNLIPPCFPKVSLYVADLVYSSIKVSIKEYLWYKLFNLIPFWWLAVSTGRDERTSSSLEGFVSKVMVCVSVSAVIAPSPCIEKITG